MSDILPIDPAEIVEEPPMPPTMAPNASIGEINDEIEENDAVEEEVVKEKKTIFEVPPKEVAINKKTGKPKRQLSEKQLAHLKKAQEASRIKRMATRAAKDLEKAHKKMDIEKRKQAKIEKKLENDSLIEFRAQIYNEEKAKAQKDSTWDETRLQNLMKSTIESYLTEKKKQKPVPKAFIPAPMNYPQMPASHQTNQQVPQQYQQQYTQQPPPIQQPIYRQQQHQNHNAISNLFGYDANNNM